MISINANAGNKRIDISFNVCCNKYVMQNVCSVGLNVSQFPLAIFSFYGTEALASKCSSPECRHHCELCDSSLVDLSLTAKYSYAVRTNINIR